MALLDLVLGHRATPAAGDAPAIIAPDLTVSRDELGDEVASLADAVAAVTTRGARVALASDNRSAVVALLLAIPASGRVAVPLNTRLTPADMTAQVARSGAEVLIGTADELLRLGPALDDAPSLQTVVGLDHGGDISLAALAAAPIRHDARGVAGDDDPAWIIYTSGTTGAPKGAVLTAASLAAGIATSVAARPLADDDVYLYPFPLYHVSAYNVLHALHRGRPVVLPRRFDAAEVFALVSEHGVTTMSLAPTMLRMLLDHAAEVGTAPLASLRSISYGAAPMAPALLAEATEVLGVGFAQGYGMTELSANAVFLTPDDHRKGLDGDERLLRAAGRPGPAVELRVVDDEGATVPAGTSGELWVRAPQVCAGYWDDPVATAATITDGWLHTGDVAVLDDDGVLSIVDRAKDIIITGGENVASREVEDAIAHHPAVARVAVVGLPDDRWGEAVVAAVVLRRDRARDAEVRSSIATEAGERLARFKVPKQIEVVDDLPVNAGGKVDKVALRRQLTGGC